MPYDKETVDRAKKLGVFDRNFDAEALKTDELERKKLVEKLRKYTSTKPSSVSVQGELELVELPIRREEVISVELSLWDRILMFLLSIFNIMPSNDYKKSKALKKIEQKLRRSRPCMIDPSKGGLSGEFGKIILLLYEHAKTLRSIFDIFLENENFWKGIGVQKSSCEYLFESITDLPNIVERYKELTTNFVSNIVDKAKSMKSAIRAIEDEISAILSSIPEDLIKRADNIFNNIIKLREFAYFDFETIVRRFTQFSEVKKGKLIFKSISAQGLVNHLKDLESVLLSLDVDDVYTTQYINIMLDYISNFSGDNQKALEIKSRLSPSFFQTLNNNIGKINISDLVAYVSKDPNHKPFVIKTNYSLFKEFSKVINDKYKRLVVSKMEEKNNKLIEKYMTIIFGKPIEIQEYGIYSTNVSNLFSKYGLPPFLYTKLLGISVAFIKNIWEPDIKDKVSNLIVAGSFSDKQLQKTLSELCSKVEPVRAKMEDFVKAVEQGGEYHILLSKFISSPSLLANESNKKVIERKVMIINGVCFEFLSAFKDIFKGMYRILRFISDDIYSPFPKTVINIHRIGGQNNREFVEGVERAVEKLNAFSSLITIFVEE